MTIIPFCAWGPSFQNLVFPLIIHQTWWIRKNKIKILFAVFSYTDAVIKMITALTKKPFDIVKLSVKLYVTKTLIQ